MNTYWVNYNDRLIRLATLEWHIEDIPKLKQALLAIDSTILDRMFLDHIAISQRTLDNCTLAFPDIPKYLEKQLLIADERFYHSGGLLCIDI
jgi:hypothetical protein